MVTTCLILFTLLLLVHLSGQVTFEAYHGATGEYHQSRFDELSQNGYRIISLSVYGDATDPRYACVWVQRPGAAWVALHGVTAEQYQQRFDELVQSGYVSTIISATGSASNPVLAGVFENIATTGQLTWFGLTEAEFNEKNKWARENGWIMKSGSVYSDSSRRFAANWLPNVAKTFWHVHVDPEEQYQATFDAETSLRYRPAFVTLSNDYVYLSVFTDDSIGPWIARHGLDSDSYQTVFDEQIQAEYYPIFTQGGGIGSDTVYTTVFAQHDIPHARVWSTAGEAVNELEDYDTIMKNFMTANNIRQGQLAIGKNGVPLLSRAYTWAEPEYQTTETNTLMRVASLSKLFTEAAIQHLYDNDELQTTTAVFPLLGYSSPKDARSDSITVQQLLDHSGGYDFDISGDQIFNMRQVALDLGLTSHISKDDIIRYMYDRDLDFAPGSRTKYSNFGYLLLGRVVEHVSGKSFIDYVRDNLAAPLNISRLYVSPTLLEDRLESESLYDDPGLAKSAFYPSSDALVPYVHGGEGWVTEVMDSGGGMATTAQDITTFIHTHKVWGNGPRPSTTGDWILLRTGSMAGVSSAACSRGDDVDWTFVLNSRAFPVGGPTVDDLITQINNKLNENKK